MRYKDINEAQKVADTAFADASKKYGVDENMLRAIAHTESQGNPYAVSKAGAQGIMQIMPGNAKKLGLSDPFDIAQNIDKGAFIFKQNLDHFGNPNDALSAYNGGWDKSKWGNKETSAYPVKVLKNLETISRVRNQTNPVQVDKSYEKFNPVSIEDIFGDDEKGAYSQPNIDKNTTKDAHDTLYSNTSPEADFKPNHSVTVEDMFAEPIDRSSQKPANNTATIKKDDSGIVSDVKNGNYSDAANKAGQVLWDTAKDAGLQNAKLEGSVAKGLGYVTSFGHKYDNALSKSFDKFSNFVHDNAPVVDAEMQNDYGRGVSKTAGQIAGDVSNMSVLGTGLGALGGGAEAATTGGRILQNVAKSKGFVPYLINNAGLAVANAEATNENPKEALEGALAFGVGGKVAEKVLSKAGKTGNALIDSLDPAGRQARLEKSPNFRDNSTGGGSGDGRYAGINGSSSRGPNVDEAKLKKANNINAISKPEDNADAYYDALGGNGDDVYEAQTPGVRLTSAVRKRNSALAAHENMLRDLDKTGSFDRFDDAQKDALASHVRSTIGDEDRVNQLLNDRAESENALREQAFSNERPVNAGGIDDRLQEIIEQNKGRPSVQSGIEYARKALADVIDDHGNVLPSKLWNVRKEIQEGIQKADASDKTNLRAASAQLQSLMPELTETIDQGAPGFKNYLADYAKRTKEIDSLRYLQNKKLLTQRTGRDGSQADDVNYSTLKSLFSDVDSKGSSKKNLPVNNLLPEHLEELRKVYNDLNAINNTRAEGNSYGSPTFKRLLTHQAMSDSGVKGAIGDTAVSAVLSHTPGLNIAYSLGRKGANAIAKNKIDEKREIMKNALIHKHLFN